MLRLARDIDHHRAEGPSLCPGLEAAPEGAGSLCASEASDTPTLASGSATYALIFVCSPTHAPLPAATPEAEAVRKCFEDAGKGIELFREQLARSRDAHVRNHARGRSVGAVRRPEGVIHIHVRQSGKGRCELRVVFGFRFVEAEVFEQKDFAVGKRFDRFFSRHANAVRSEVDLGLEVASEGFCDDA